MFSAKTSHEGKFSIPNFNFRDSTELVFNALDKRNTAIDVQIMLDSNKINLPIPRFKGMPTGKSTDAVKAYSDFSATRKNMRLIYDYGNATELEEVVLTERVTKKDMPAMPSTLGQTPDATLYTKDTHESGLTLMDFVARFSGVTVTGSFPYITVSVRGGGAPLWVLNGNPVITGVGQLRPSVPGQIASMDILNVERVELLKGPSAAIWGSRGGDGVFLVYTKRGGSETLDPAISPSFSIFGHAAKREFYSPKYDANFEGQDVPDYRATLYWNPSFTTDRNGNAQLIFYNSDNAKQFQVAIEGLSEYGTPGAYLKTFGQKD